MNTEEERLFKALDELTALVEKGFSELSGRFEAIEKRLGIQEEETKKTRKIQSVQASELLKLQSIVRKLAEERPVRSVAGGTVIKRSDAYAQFEDLGIGPRKAMCSLSEAGTIRSVREATTGKLRNTIVVRINGDVQRVIIVEKEAKH